MRGVTVGLDTINYTPAATIRCIETVADQQGSGQQGDRVLTRAGLIATFFSVSVCLSGCGGSGGDLSGTGNSGGGSSTPNASPGGIWKGTETVSGEQVFGVADELGDFWFERADGVLYAGTATTSGTSLSANFDGYVLNGNTFPDGSNYGTGTLSGTIEARTSISAKTQFTTANSNSSTGQLSLTFDTLYNSASSLATISGNFTISTDGTAVTIGSNGTLYSQDSKTGCVLNGTVYIINASYNAYKVVFDLASCTGASVAVNGVQFTGVATLDTSVSPQVVYLWATGASGSAKYALAYTLSRS